MASKDDEGLMIRGVVFEEGDRKFYSVDISGFDPTCRPGLEQIEQQMERLGLSRMGDLICGRFSNVVMRGFATEGGTVYGIAMIPAIGEPVVEFYSSFEDGASLTTTTQPGRTMPPESKIHHERLLPGASVEDLWVRHGMAIDTREPETGPARQLDATLTGLAAAVEEFLQRQFGALASAF